jgi:TolA-binding protein
VASADRLERVHVDHGLVEVRPRGGDSVLLGMGETWIPAPPTPAAEQRPAPPEAPAAPAAARRVAAPVAQTRLAPALDSEEPLPEALPSPAPTAPPTSQDSEAERAFAAGWDDLRDGHPGAAATAFRQSYVSDPSGALGEDAQFWEAVALARADRKGEAREAMQAFLQQHPRAARAAELSVMLGWLLLDAGEQAAARARFEAALDDTRPAVREGARKGLAAVREKR